MVPAGYPLYTVYPRPDGGCPVVPWVSSVQYVCVSEVAEGYSVVPAGYPLYTVYPRPDGGCSLGSLGIPASPPCSFCPKSLPAFSPCVTEERSARLRSPDLHTNRSGSPTLYKSYTHILMFTAPTCGTLIELNLGDTHCLLTV